MILIADSGSTKTEWCLLDKASGSTKTIYTQGINPFQMTEDTIVSILTSELLPSIGASSITAIHFYGAGCTPEKSPIVASAIKKALKSAVIPNGVLPIQGELEGVLLSVHSDMLGAARGLCGSSSGIVCILGTGSNACFYDGSVLHPGNPALGFILGDEGSGAYIGKRLAGDILKRQMSSHICDLFFKETGETSASIIQKVYREPLPNRYLASLSKFCYAHRDEADIQSLLVDCFKQFFRRNIVGVYDACTSDLTVHFVGSIAHYYRSELSLAAESCGFAIGKVMQAPMAGLIEFHRETHHHPIA